MRSLLSPSPTATPRRWAWAAPLLGLAVVLSACGGSPAKASTTPTTTGSSSTTGGSSTAAFTACMTSHGIPASALGNFTRGGGGFGGGGGGFGGGGGGSAGTGSAGTGSTVPRTFPTVSLPAGVTQQDLTTALQACRADLPNRGGFGGGAGLFGSSAADAAYRNCLQVNGVTLPTRPAAGSSTTSSASPPTTINFNSPTYQAALKACASLRPTRGSSSTTTSTPA